MESKTKTKEVKMYVARCNCCGLMGNDNDTDEGYSPCCNKTCDSVEVTLTELNKKNWNL